MKRSKAVAALYFWLLTVPGVCCAADSAAVVAANPAQSETIVIRLSVNTEDKGDIFVERTRDKDFLLKLQDLKAMGFRDPNGVLVMVDGEAYMSLRSMAGVVFDFREKELALHVSANPQLLSAQSIVLEGQPRRDAAVLPNQNSAFVNYAVNAAHGPSVSSRPGFTGELGWRFRDFLFLTDASTVQAGNGEQKFVRLMSSVTHDDREQLRRTIVGDFFTPAREFSSGVNVGGFGVSKLYGLNPYFIQFPMQSITGNVALPSDMEVYVDGQRVRSERLRPGEFELRDILAYGGARNVQLVLRDAFGRVQQLDYAFYFSDQPLSRGLHEYSYNLGAIRRSYGIASGRYGPAAFSLFHRYGVTDAVTLGIRAEGSRGILNAGPTATMVLGSLGVANLAVAGSSIAGRHGTAALASYTFHSNRWALGASMRRDWGLYAPLGEQVTLINRKHEASFTASYQLGRRGTISGSHSLFLGRRGISSSTPTPSQPFAVAALSNRRVTTLSYSTPLVSGWASLTTSLSHIKDQPRGARNEIFVGITVFLNKDYSVAGSSRDDKDIKTQSLQVTKQQPIGEGLGFYVAADRSTDLAGEHLRLKSTVQYNAPAALIRADLGRNRNQQGEVFDDYRVSVAGGIGLVGGTLAFGRPITGSFGVVKVADLSGVGVLLNGQPIGKTDSQGKAFIPTLSPYLDNRVSIAAETVPIDYSIKEVSRKTSPSLRSGVLIEFAVSKLQAVTGRLKAQHKEGFKSVEFEEIRLPSIEGQKRSGFQTGRGGEFYIENLGPGTYPATVMMEGKPCPFDLVVPQSAETFVELGDVVCRPSH